MTMHRDWASVADANFVVVTRATAPDEIACRIDTSHALYIGDGNGDGLVIEGDLADLARWVDTLHQHVHATIPDDSDTHDADGTG